jgi:hypothetical protein
MGRVPHVLVAVATAVAVLAVAGASSAASQTCGSELTGAVQACGGKERPRTSVLRAGICVDDVPKTVRAGDTLIATCRFAQPLIVQSVVVTPAFSDAFAEPTYVLKPAVDFTYQLDLDSGSSDDFLVILRILRDIAPPFPTPDVDHHAVLFTYLATGSTP